MANRIDYFYYNWGPYLWTTELDKNIIDKLKFDGERTKIDYNSTLAGHLNNQFGYGTSTQKWFNNEIKDILSVYRQGHCEYHGLENFEVKYELIDMWINYMKPGDFNPTHTHAGDLSFVIFLDVPKELDKERQDFVGTSIAPGALSFSYGTQSRPIWARTGVHIVPRDRGMYIFPSLLEHTVVPFKSDVTRISVSGNFRMTNRDTLPDNYY